MAFDLSTTSWKTVQQIEKLYNKSTLYDKSYNFLYNKSTANPQQIEQVEFELKSSSAAMTLQWLTECWACWMLSVDPQGQYKNFNEQQTQTSLIAALTTFSFSVHLSIVYLFEI
jgi:hypothetical protein